MSVNTIIEIILVGVAVLFAFYFYLENQSKRQLKKLEKKYEATQETVAPQKTIAIISPTQTDVVNELKELDKPKKKFNFNPFKKKTIEQKVEDAL